MSNYTKSTNFATKDNLTPGDPLKIVRGTEIDTEFNNIATAIATKTDNSAAAITGGSITGITDLAIADGGTGASTATAAINNLLPSQTSNANKYLQTDGTNVSWDAVSLSTSDITGTLPVANGGTGVTSSTGTGSVVLSNSPTLVTPALGTPASGVATNLTGLPISTGVSGLGTGVATFLGTPSSANLASAVSDETGSGALVFANSPTLVTPALGTPSSATLTNATGLPISTGVSGLGTGVATFLATPSSANLASAVSDETGSGALVFANSPTLVTPALGTPSSGTLTNATGLPISTGVSGLGTGVATALAVNVGSAGAPVVNGGALGTPSSGTVTNLTGTASININGTVGATTPTTGAFTTLSASSSVTLSGGTANGVTYLNGSKVLTSGSALTFDGSKLGVNIASPATALHVADTNYPYITVSNTSGTEIKNTFGANGINQIAYLGTTTNHSLGFLINDSEQMRLTSTGLGIGTSSPVSGAKLTVSGSSYTSSNIFTGGNNTGVFFTGSTTDYTYGIGRETAGLMLYSGNATARATLDSAGNLGLGTSSPGYKLDVNGTFGLGTGQTGNVGVFGANTATVDTYFRIRNTAGAFDIGTAATGHYFYGQGSLPLQFFTNATERMRLDTYGNLGIGTSSPAAKLDVNGGANSDIRVTTSGSGYLQLGQFTNGAFIGTSSTDATAGILRLGTGGTERARIDSSGNLLVGTTSGGYQNSNSIAIQPLALGAYVVTNHANGTVSGREYSIFTYNASAIGSITQNGTTAVAYNTSSDYRLKNTIAPMTGALDKVALLKPCTYKWNIDGSDGEGFIAHELAEVCPQAVSGEKDAVDEEGNPKYQGIDTSFLVATLTAAIQELKAEFDAYKASHP